MNHYLAGSPGDQLTDQVEVNPAIRPAPQTSAQAPDSPSPTPTPKPTKEATHPVADAVAEAVAHPGPDRPDADADHHRRPRPPGPADPDAHQDETTVAARHHAVTLEPPPAARPAPVTRGPLDPAADGRRPFLPSRDDPVVRVASGAIGGPWGRHGALGLRRFWTPLRVLLALTVLTLAFAWLQKSPCQDGAWTEGKQYTHFCYSDVIPLYFTEHLNEGAVPYVDQAVEYPVLTGAFMGVAAAGGEQAAVRRAAGGGVLRRHRAAAGAVHARGHLEHVPAGRATALGRRDGRAVPAGDRARVHQLGPVRGRARRGRAGRLAGATTRAGRRAARPRHRCEALPAAVLPAAAGALLAITAAARVLAGRGRRDRRVVRGRPAGRRALPGLVAAVPEAQPGASGRLRLALVRLPPARRQRPGTEGQRRRRGDRAGRAGRGGAVRPDGAAPAPAAAAAVPRRRRVPADEQGVEPAVLVVAAAAGRAGPAVLAGAAGPGRSPSAWSGSRGCCGSSAPAARASTTPGSSAPCCCATSPCSRSAG